MSLPNPLVSRMEWVAKNYGDYVTMATFGAWAEATGQHGFREHMARMFQDVTMEGRRHWAMGNLARFGKDWRAPMDSRFDRYLPWAAREFNRMLKPYTKVAKREGLPAFPAEYDLAARRMAERRLGDFDAYHRGLTALGQDTRVLQDRFRAIVDWAEGAQVDLNRYDWEEASVNASSWGEAHGEHDVTQGEVVFAFDDGWTVQELTTKEQLADEDEAMQHCVGEYFDEVSAGTARIFSLRDPRGQPHATLEWDVAAGFVPQLKGKQNVAPLRPYLLRMIPFRRAVLDPLSKVRPQSGFEPGIYEEFRVTFHTGTAATGSTAHYLGAWAFNPEGLLQDKIGGYGALEAAMENDVLYLVYQAADQWSAYALDDLANGVRAIEEKVGEAYCREWDASLSEDENFQIEEQEQRELLSKSVERTYARDVALSADVGGLDWAVWSCHGIFPSTAEDEMVEHLHSEGVQPPAVVAAIKDRLLQC